MIPPAARGSFARTCMCVVGSCAPVRGSLDPAPRPAMSGGDYAAIKTLGNWVHTPPDLGILTTVSCAPYARCISTLSFSCPTTRMTLTVLQKTCIEHIRATDEYSGCGRTFEGIYTGLDELLSVLAGARAGSKSRRRVDNQSSHPTCLLGVLYAMGRQRDAGTYLLRRFRTFRLCSRRDYG